MCLFLSRENDHTRERIDITLPEETIRLLDRAVPNGSRSRFIDKTIRHLIRTESNKQLKDRIKKGAIARAGRDLDLAEAWFVLEDGIYINK